MSQCYLLLIGGYETVGSALSFALYHIVRDPRIEEKVLQEIHEVLGDKVSKVVLSKDNHIDLGKTSKFPHTNHIQTTKGPL